MTSHRFFIALLPPQTIQQRVNEIKQHFADVYQSRKAFKSPPHITLQPPFHWEDANISVLEYTLAEFARNRGSIPILLSGFGAFKPRVIFVNPLKTPELMKIQEDLGNYLARTLSIVDEKSKFRSFSPHITVAFQDLTSQNFKKAWPEFEKREFQFEFTISELTLLIYEDRKWEIAREFPLEGLN
ncbi:MAG: 2'-5' RNA ligase family protein [Cyanobacteriota bacterium]|nr:2'-5' RNA ligase family protein [Cyanobacteriota bacterium]